MLDFRLARFIAAGMANTAAGLTLIFAFKALLGMGDVAANALGYALAVVLGFVLNRNWTFSHTGCAAAALLRYLVVLSVAYSLNLATVLYALEVLHVNSYAAQAAGIIPYAAAGYLGSRLFAFPQSKPR